MRENYRVSAEASPRDPWSPAHNPHAIAVSEAQWWLWTLGLCARRVADGRDPDRQVDARQFIVALRQLAYAADMQQKATVDAPPAARRAIGEARRRFVVAVPGVIEARDILVHFDRYALGEGNQQRRLRSQSDVDEAEAARHFWCGGYDPATGEFAVGPHHIPIQRAYAEARALFGAIYNAAQAVDEARRATPFDEASG